VSRTDRRTGRHAEPDPERIRRRATLEERLAIALADGDRELVSRLRDALAELDE
jgi:hypothetical protein